MQFNSSFDSNVHSNLTPILTEFFNPISDGFWGYPPILKYDSVHQKDSIFVVVENLLNLSHSG